MEKNTVAPSCDRWPSDNSRTPGRSTISPPAIATQTAAIRRAPNPSPSISPPITSTITGPRKAIAAISATGTRAIA